MKQIPLTQDKFALVDDDIYEVVNNYKWHVHKGRNTWYALRHMNLQEDPSGKFEFIRLHHIVVGIPPKGFEVDHKDGNGLNNQRENLQIVTKRKNQQNTCVHRTGRLVGTTWHKNNQKWLAKIQINGKMKHLGYFKTEQEAHEAYMKALENLK